MNITNFSPKKSLLYLCIVAAGIVGYSQIYAGPQAAAYSRKDTRPFFEQIQDQDRKKSNAKKKKVRKVKALSSVQNNSRTD